MKLLLTSAGFTNKTIVGALKELVGRDLKEVKLVFVPTAANVEEGGKEWLITDLYNCKKLGLLEVDIVDISAVPEDIWGPRLERADILMFGGGNTFHLMHWLKKSGLVKRLPGMLVTKVYVGISAGSMVAGQGLSLSQDAKLYYENVGQSADYSALGLVNLSIRPHLNSKWFPKVTIEYLAELTKNMTEPVYAIDDQSAVVVNGNKISVVSEGKWKRFS